MLTKNQLAALEHVYVYTVIKHRPWDFFVDHRSAKALTRKGLLERSGSGHPFDPECYRLTEQGLVVAKELPFATGE